MMCKRCLPGLLALIVCAMTLPAVAQTAVGSDIASGLAALASAPDDQVPAARRKIADLVSKGVDAATMTVVQASFPAALNSTRPIVRLNAAMLLADLADADPAGGAKPLIVQALKATGPGSPAVHYWAGKAAATLGRKGKLSPENQADLTKELLAAAAAENATASLQQMLVAAACFDSPDAAKQLLDLLDQRVDAHMKNFNLTIAPEREAMRTLYQIRNNPAESKVVPNDLVIRISKTTFRYMDFAGQLLDLDPAVLKTLGIASTPHPAELVQLLAIGDQVLLWSVDKLSQGAAIKAPESIRDDVTAKPLPIANIRFKIEKWRIFLTAPDKPFAIPPAELTPLPFPKKPA